MLSDSFIFSLYLKDSLTIVQNLNEKTNDESTPQSRPFGYTLPNPTNSTNSLLRTTFRGTLNDKIRFANGAVARSGTADHVWHLKLYLVNHEPEEVIVLLN